MSPFLLSALFPHTCSPYMKLLYLLEAIVIIFDVHSSTRSSDRQPARPSPRNKTEKSDNLEIFICKRGKVRERQVMAVLGDAWKGPPQFLKSQGCRRFSMLNTGQLTHPFCHPSPCRTDTTWKPHGIQKDLRRQLTRLLSKLCRLSSRIHGKSRISDMKAMTASNMIRTHHRRTAPPAIVSRRSFMFKYCNHSLSVDLVNESYVVDIAIYGDHPVNLVIVLGIVQNEDGSDEDQRND